MFLVPVAAVAEVAARCSKTQVKPERERTHHQSVRKSHRGSMREARGPFANLQQLLAQRRHLRVKSPCLARPAWQQVMQHRC